MTHAFIVLTHRQPLESARLLEALEPYDTFVHVDSSVGQVSIAGLPPHVCLAPVRHCIHWGGYSMVRAMIETLDFALRETESNTRQFTFLSGQCYPIRSVADFVHYSLTTATPVLCRGYALASHPVPGMGTRRVTQRHWLDGPIGHLRKAHPNLLTRGLRRTMAWATVPFRVLPPDVQLTGGSQWSSLPRQLCQELVCAYRVGSFDYLRNAYASDEIAIPTFVYNSPWRVLTPLGHPEQPQLTTMAEFSNFHWLRPCMKGVITVEDIAAALSSDAYFIRKMPQDQRSPLFKRIQDAW